MIYDNYDNPKLPGDTDPTIVDKSVHPYSAHPPILLT